MEIKNEALLKMLDSASKLKKQKDSQLKEDDVRLLDNLPSVNKSSTELDTTEEESFIPSLSLDADVPITRESLLSNVEVKERRFRKGSLETLNKAKRKVGRLTTGASAAVPLVCQGTKCPFKARCVHEDTLVFTPKGFKKIKDFKERDLIYSFNSEGCLEKDTVTQVIYNGIETTFKIKTGYGFELIVTEDHPILTFISEDDTKDYLNIRDGLKVGSTVFIIDENLELIIDSLDFGDMFEDTIKSIEPYKASKVYDISVENNSNFIANNIAVHNCPYFKEDLHELGEDCLVEEQLVQYWTQKYADELEVDYNSISEMHMISNLVEITIMEVRMNNYLAINDQALMMEFIASVDPQGNILSNKGASVALDIKERLQRQKLKLLETLNNTREKKAKLIIETGSAVNKENSKNLLNKLDKLYNKLNNNDGPQTIDAEVRDVN